MAKSVTPTGTIPHILELTDPDYFTTFDDLPGNPFGEVSEAIVSGRGWYLLATIERSMHLMRPLYLLRDTDNRQLTLAFYVDRGSPQEQAAYKYKPGTVIGIQRAFWHGFADGQQGVRIETEDFNDVSNVPCSMEKLIEYNNKLRDTGSQPGTCGSCDKTKPASRCSRCMQAYCNAECQKTDWTSHKVECKIRQFLRARNEEYFEEVYCDDDSGDFDGDSSVSDNDTSNHPVDDDASRPVKAEADHSVEKKNAEKSLSVSGYQKA